MAKYRKKPVEIDAIRVSEILKLVTTDWKSLPQWVQDCWQDERIHISPNRLTIQTPEGLMTAEGEDWLVRGVIGEIYPVKNVVFQQTYELADPFVGELEAVKAFERAMKEQMEKESKAGGLRL